jgi:hypothetical protein
VAFYTQTPYAAQFRDAETNLPLPGAAANIGYRIVAWFPILNPPWTGSKTADANGDVAITIADFGAPDIHWSAPGYYGAPDIHFSAPGYVDYGDCDDFNRLRSIPALPPQVQKSGKNRLIIPMYRLPGPTAEILLPSHYTGPLCFDFRPAPAPFHGTIGERHFIFAASPSGYLPVSLTPLQMNLHFEGGGTEQQVTYRFTNGSPIPNATVQSPDMIALHWLPGARYSPGRIQRLAFVGTTAQFHQALAAVGLPPHADADSAAATPLFHWPESIP